MSHDIIEYIAMSDVYLWHHWKSIYVDHGITEYIGKDVHDIIDCIV